MTGCGVGPKRGVSQFCHCEATKWPKQSRFRPGLLRRPLAGPPRNDRSPVGLAFVLQNLGRRGFGLVLVVVALAVLGFLSLTTFGIARREFRNAMDDGFAAEAFEAAESGLAAAAASAAGFGGAPRGVPQPGPGSPGGRTRFETTAIRLTGSALLLLSTGERLGGAGEVLARRRLGLIGKIVPATGLTPARFLQLNARGWAQLY
jgi:hypothetical protein